MLSRADALKEVATLDIFLQTSRYEGLSLALLEAQVAGIPAVVTNIPGNDEVVQHQVTGYVANSRQELEQLTETLINSVVLRKTMGQAARRYAQQHFSFDCMGERYKRCYQHIAEKKYALGDVVNHV
jgi:glycosyltransferase involved in cell wall biosynthesis